MKIRFIVIALALSGFFAACQDTGSRGSGQLREESSKTEAIPGNIDWIFSLPEGLVAAKQNSRPLMVDFYADWCGWCKKLDRDVYSDPGIIKLSKQFVSVKVDADKNREDCSKYGVNGLPTIVFLKPDGQVIEKFIGYREKQEFMRVMTSITKNAGIQ